MVADEDVGLRRLNDSYYASDPADYLRTRWQLLLLAGARRDALADLLAEGLEYEGIVVGAHQTSATDDPVQRDDLERYLMMEAVVLHHHAAEALLRIYVAHAAQPDAPWIDVASRRHAGPFKELVQEHFIDSTPARDEVGQVCLGNAGSPSGGDAGEWADAVDGLTSFLRSFAKTFLDDAPLYNALKHGLGASAGSAVLAIEGLAIGHGSSIEYPESKGWIKDERVWSLTTLWLPKSEMLGLTHIAIAMIDAIWRVASARRSSSASDRESVGPLFFPAHLRPSDLRATDRGGARRMSWTVVHERRGT